MIRIDFYFNKNQHVTIKQCQIFNIKNCLQIVRLKQINIPSSVTNIGENAFYNCISLTQIEIPSSVSSVYRITNIDHRVFSYCTSLTQIQIPYSVTYIGNNVICVKQF